MDIESGSVVTAAVEPLYAGRFFEVRVLMPADAFTAMPLTSNEPALNRIVAQETAWAEEANRQRAQRAAAYRNQSGSQ